MANFYFVQETEWGSINFGTLSDLRVEIFYCCCKGTVSLLLGKSYPEPDVHQRMYLALIFLSICPAICTSCIKKQKQKSKEHSGLMDHEGNEKDSDEEKNQNPRFADN